MIFNDNKFLKFRFAKTSNDAFGLVVFLQYSVSSVVICVSVYELTKVKLFSTAFAASVLYLACMLAQIFIYCFYGGETTLQVCSHLYFEYLRSRLLFGSIFI